MHRRHAVAFAVVATVLFGIATAHAGEIPVTPEREKALRAAITARDYVCPRVKLIWDKGTHADGDHFRVWCGPANREGIYSRLIYLLIVSPSGRVTVRPDA